jgi:hypothetical protein
MHSSLANLALLSGAAAFELPNPFAQPRVQLSTRFVALKASVGVEDVLATPRWPDAWPYTAADLRRQDESDDRQFYAAPRFCYHVDEAAVAALTDYYAAEFPKVGAARPSVLDLCASHVSHFPADVADYTGKRVVSPRARVSCHKRDCCAVVLMWLPHVVT